MAVASELTVIIPVYNRPTEIMRCLDSIASQTLRPARIIVVDDGSTDNTAEVARRHGVGAEVVAGSHAGAASARNVGLELVTTAWTMFFDSDDVMHPDHIETAMNMVSEDVDIVGWDTIYKWIKGGQKILPFTTTDTGYQNILHGTMSTQRYMGRTCLFRQAGGWNGEVSLWDDVELGARLLALNPRIVKKDTATVTVYQTEQSITGVLWADKANRFEISLKTLRKDIDISHHDWVDLKTAIVAADIWREDRQKGRYMYNLVTKKSLGVRLAFNYRRLGGRGTARLLRLFFSKEK